MANVEKLVPFILKWESGTTDKKLTGEQLFEKARKTGFANDKDDNGGATMCGVTYNTYKAYCKKKGYPVPTVERLKNISYKDWLAILKTMYWNRWKADQIQSQSIANLLVDWVWASGIHGIKKPQALLGVKADGIVGNKTLSAVNFADPDQLFEAIFKERVKFINGIVSRSVVAYEKKIGRKATEKELLKYTQKRFLSGWMNRLNDIKKLR